MRYEKPEVWKNARELCTPVHQFIQKEQSSKNYILAGQVKGSSGSIMDNISEEFELNRIKKSSQFLFVSNGSAGEIWLQLNMAPDNSCITDEEFQNARIMAGDTAKMLSGLMNYLNSSVLKGTKNK